MTLLDLDKLKKPQGKDVKFDGNTYSLATDEQIVELDRRVKGQQAKILTSHKDLMKTMRTAENIKSESEQVSFFAKHFDELAGLETGDKMKNEMLPVFEEFFDAVLLTDGKPAQKGKEFIDFLGYTKMTAFYEKLVQMANTEINDELDSVDNVVSLASKRAKAKTKK